MVNQFAEIYEVELECWCYGLKGVNKGIDNSVLHKVIKEFAPVLHEAVRNLYVCNILETAERLVKASKLKVSEREIAFYILSMLPAPVELNEEQQNTVLQIVDIVEKVYSGAAQRLEKKWKATNPPAPVTKLVGELRSNARA